MFTSRILYAVRHAFVRGDAAAGHGRVLQNAARDKELLRCYEPGFHTRCHRLSSRIALRGPAAPLQRLTERASLPSGARQALGEGGGRASSTRAGAMRFAFASSQIDPTNVFVLRQFITRGGRIKPRRITGLSAKLQRKVSRAIKRARSSGLLSPVKR